MFCKYCGTKNEKDGKFCVSCGADLTSTNFDYQAFIKKYKGLIIGFVVLVLLFIFAFSSNHDRAPKRVVEQFLSGFTTCDVDLLIDTMYVDQDDWEDMTRKEKKEYLEIDEEVCEEEGFSKLKFQIKDADIEGKKGTVKVKITFEKRSNIVHIPVIKRNGKWYVDASPYFKMYTINKVQVNKEKE